MLNANQNPHTWLALEDRAPTRLRLSEFSLSQIVDIWQTIWVIWENRLNWSNLRLNEYFCTWRLNNNKVPQLHPNFTNLHVSKYTSIPTNLNMGLRYNSDKLEMIQRMHRLRVIGLSCWDSNITQTNSSWLRFYSDNNFTLSKILPGGGSAWGQWKSKMLECFDIVIGLLHTTQKYEKKLFH